MSVSDGQVSIPTLEELKAWHDKCWAELDPEIKIKAMAAIRVALNQQTKDNVKKLFWMDPLGWSISFHFGWGMAIRNKIRELTGVLDDQLPSGNWDDYYVAVVEAALGLREIL